MRIDNNCIRDILLTVEEKSTYKTACHIPGYKEKFPLLKQYENDKLWYHIRYAKMKKLVYTPEGKQEESIDLTPEGHDYLNSIRENNGI